jgi:hypothetical protein
MPRDKNAPDRRDQTGRDRDAHLPSGGSETGATRGASHLPGGGDEPARHVDVPARAPANLHDEEEPS